MNKDIGKGEIEIGIRPWSEGDIQLLERLMGDPAMTEHLGGPETPEKIRERHERYCRLDGTGKGRMFVIVAGPDRVAAGSIGYWEIDRKGELVWETGWSVLPEFQGLGVATKGGIALLEQARAEGKHRFIHAFPPVENTPSNAICRKLGFTLVEVSDYEYPPGNPIRCNDWRLDLFESKGELR